MKSLYLAFIAMLAVSGCQQKSKNLLSVQVLQTNGADAVAPYLTLDNHDMPVLCWTEKDRHDSTNVLKYAYFDSEHLDFGKPMVVSPSKGMNTAAESMGKVAFKADGTAFAFFSRRFEKEKNPFAGAIFYSSSNDGGKTWSAQRFLHSDTAHTYGRSFFDVSGLKDGQIAAVWLDGRYGKSIEGSALYFARTQKGKGFDRDSCLDKGTCECCRTDLLKDESGNLHLAYRKVLFPPERMGKQVRDIVYQASNDNGRTFSVPQAISKDNWEIDACPHSGPTLAFSNNGLHAVWFTAAGAPGLYASTKRVGSTAFSSRNLISASGRHPQILSLAGGQFAMVCEEPIESRPEMPMKMGAGHAGMQMKYAPAAAAKIILRILKHGNTTKTIELSDGQSRDSHAVLVKSKDALIVVWVREDNGHATICYSRIGLDVLQT